MRCHCYGIQRRHRRSESISAYTPRVARVEQSMPSGDGRGSGRSGRTEPGGPPFLCLRGERLRFTYRTHIMSALNINSYITTHSGLKIPQLGFGNVFGEAFFGAIEAALKAGYRHCEFECYCVPVSLAIPSTSPSISHVRQSA